MNQLVAGIVLSTIVAQQVEVIPSTTHVMPALVDSNSPVFWWQGNLRMFNSAGFPLLSEGIDQFQMHTTNPIEINNYARLPLWIEAALVDEDGRLFAWYHHEPGHLCPAKGLTAPRIGALVSLDGGQTFEDLGIILEDGYPVNCSAPNGFFGGGHGDFSVIADRDRQYLYFVFSNYSGPLEEQGVALARLRYEDRLAPAGKVEKYFEGAWREPGLGGRVTAVLPARAGWDTAETDAFWGPSIHWNHYLEKYVVLLNRSCCEPGWPESGIWVVFVDSLADPTSLSEPQLILDDIPYSPAWYPQVIGLGPEETDSFAGERARLWIKGLSSWELRFRRDPAPAEPVNKARQSPPGRPRAAYRGANRWVEPPHR